MSEGIGKLTKGKLMETNSIAIENNVIPSSNMLLISVLLISIIALCGFFWKKKEGFGKYNTSTFLLLLVLIFSSIMYSSHQLKDNAFINILFAIIGFAGGLFTSSIDESKKEKTNSKNTKQTNSTDINNNKN